jgi:hypothetical protein
MEDEEAEVLCEFGLHKLQDDVEVGMLEDLYEVSPCFRGIDEFIFDDAIAILD